jgi:hypothetical protein
MNELLYVRAMKPSVPHDILKMMYHSYFHSVVKYGIILLGIPLNFRLQKRVARIIMGVGTRGLAQKF